MELLRDSFGVWQKLYELECESLTAEMWGQQQDISLNSTDNKKSLGWAGTESGHSNSDHGPHYPSDGATSVG